MSGEVLGVAEMPSELWGLCPLYSPRQASIFCLKRTSDRRLG